MHQNWKMHIFSLFCLKRKNNFVLFTSQRTYLYSCVCTNAENRGKLCWLLNCIEDKSLNGG